jgi:hypothetical protein
MLTPSTSKGAERVIGRAAFVPISGPVFAGPSVAWVETTRDGKITVRRGPATGGETDVISGIPRSAGKVQLVGSPAGLVAEVDEFHQVSRGASVQAVRVFVADPGAAFRVLAPTCELSEYDRLRNVDVDGADLLSPATAGYNICSAALNSLDGQSPGQDLGSGHLKMLRLANNAASWFEGEGLLSNSDIKGYNPDDLVVVDRSSSIVRRFPAASIPGTVASMDLAGSGAFAVGFSERLAPGRAGGLLMGAPDGSSLSRAPLPRGHYVPRYAGEGLAVLGSQWGFGGQGTVLRLDPATGAVIDTLVTGTADAQGSEMFDFDGTRVAFVRPGCNQTEIVVQEGPGTKQTAESRRCPSHLIGRASIRGSTLRLRVSCAGAPRDCLPDVTARLNGRVIARGVGTPNSGPDGTVTLRLRSEAVRTLANQRTAHLSLAVRLGSTRPAVASGFYGPTRYGTVTAHVG